ncbi:NAD(P)/FAD-dependent oxidoreductase [candidate division KSB1 bacterium]
MSETDLENFFNQDDESISEESSSRIRLEDGAKIGVIGGGPAGSFVSYFLLVFAKRFGLDINVDIIDPQDYSRTGPRGCNHCGGIISETLVQIMAADGINVPSSVVQRGINSYVLHMDEGWTNIDTPRHEKRIAAVFRGVGPRGIKEMRWGNSFDRYLQLLAFNKGANIIKERAEEIKWQNGLPVVKTNKGNELTYDLLIGAVGVNTNSSKLFEFLDFGYKSPKTTKTYINELPIGNENVQKYLGSSMHLFLLNIPGLEFAALIPKGDFATFVMLGEKIDRKLVQSLLNSDQVKQCLPPEWNIPDKLCHCAPRININEAKKPFTDRFVAVGDCGAGRLYKDGIGAAYRTAKAAANTAIFEGISKEDFQKHYMPIYKGISIDNMFGKVIFGITKRIQKTGFAQKAILKIVHGEQKRNGDLRLSGVLWDTFTGSAPYKDVFLRTLHPAFISSFAWNILLSIIPYNRFKQK